MLGVGVGVGTQVGAGLGVAVGWALARLGVLDAQAGAGVLEPAGRQTLRR